MATRAGCRRTRSQVRIAGSKTVEYTGGGTIVSNMTTMAAGTIQRTANLSVEVVLR